MSLYQVGNFKDAFSHDVAHVITCYSSALLHRVLCSVILPARFQLA